MDGNVMCGTAAHRCKGWFACDAGAKQLNGDDDVSEDRSFERKLLKFRIARSLTFLEYEYNVYS